MAMDIASRVLAMRANAYCADGPRDRAEKGGD